MSKYKCSLGVTALVKPIVWISGSVYAFCTCFAEGAALSVGGLGFAVFTLILYLDMPVSVTVDDDAITIAYVVAPFSVEFSDIISIKKVVSGQSSFYMRQAFYAGNALDAVFRFGYQGVRYKDGVGKMTWYCTQLKNYIVIEAKGEQYPFVITPDDPDGLLAEIKRLHPHLVSHQTL